MPLLRRLELSTRNQLHLHEILKEQSAWESPVEAIDALVAAYPDAVNIPSKDCYLAIHFPAQV